MRQLLNRLGDFYETLPDRLRARRWIIWPAFVIAVAVIAPGAARFKLDLSDEQFFSRTDPVRIAYDRYNEQFGSDEFLYIVYRAKDGDVFSEQSLRAVRGIQEDLLNYRLQLKDRKSSPLDHVTEVTTINNVSYLEGTSDALISRPFIGERIPTTKKARDALRTQALAHPDFPLIFVSKNSTYGGILIRTDLGDPDPLSDDAQSGFDEAASFDVASDAEMIEADAPKPHFTHPSMEVYQAVTHAVYDIINKPEYAGVFEYFPVGVPVINTDVVDNLMPQINIAMASVVGIMVVMLTLLFRSASAVVWPVIIIGITALLVIATLGWLGLDMNLMVNVVVLLVMVVGVADSVHILSGYLFFRNHGHDHHEAMRKTFHKSGVAVMLTSITTALGMLALTTVPIVHMQMFGFASALGVILAFVVTVVMLPLMLDIWHPVSKRRAKQLAESGPQQHVVQKLLRRIEHLSYAYPVRNVVIFSAVSLFFLVGVSQIKVETNFLKMFHPDAPIQTAHRVVDEFMGGTMGLALLIDAHAENALQDPVVLNAMDGLQQWFNERFPDKVIRTRSLVNIVKSSNQSLNGGRKAAYSIPQDARVLSQTLFLFNNANPTDRRKVVSDDYRQAHINITTINLGSRHYIEILNELDGEIEKRFAAVKVKYPDFEVTPTGGLTLIVKMLDYLSWSQIKGFSLALIAISLVLLFIYSSKRIGLIALYPNLFPLVIVFGLMGYLNISLDMDTLIVAPLMIGIVVDDTIHFLTHYRALVSKHGNIDNAIVESFREVGQAIAFTSFILAAAFLAFGLLDHQGLKHFGVLSSTAILAALAGDLFLLPALLKLTNTRFESQAETAAIAEPTA